MGSTFDTQYLKPSTIAERLSMHRSQIYNMIKDGTLPHIRIGKAVRVPAAAFEVYLTRLEEEQQSGHGGPEMVVVKHTTEHDLRDRVQEFVAHTHRDPFEFVEAWKHGEIEDTPENAELALDALGLRTALQRAESAAVTV